MIENLKMIVCTFLIVAFSSAQSADSLFAKLEKSSEWQLAFEDTGTTDWNEKWSLDGLMAQIETNHNGMHFKAGPEWKNDAHHVVLWTKKNFQGNLKIEYDYTRTDHESKGVNIIYIQATGTGEEPYVKDISLWNELRTVPSMRTYFNHMNALHISYAAFGNSADTSYYIRARRYPKPVNQSFDLTRISPSYEDKGYFESFKTYHITILKTVDCLVFRKKSETEEETFVWHIDKVKPIMEGKVGLRHMYTRAARYKNFKIYEEPNRKF